MIFLFVSILVVGYALAASRATRGGGAGRLWLAALCTLALVALLATLLGLGYDVPSLSRLLLYTMALAGPVVLVPTSLLHYRTSVGRGRDGDLGTALTGGLAGLVCGFLLVVYVLGVW